MKITNLMKNIFYALLPLLFFVACTSEEPQTTNPTPDDTPTNTPSISLDQTRLDFDEQADSQTIYFTSAMDWTAELINDRADSWCSISATSGKSGNGQITVSVTENTSTDDRTASIIIKSGPLSRTVRISQKQKDALTVTTSRFEVESTRGKIYIEVKANIDFEYTINGTAADWITPIETRALKTTKLGFNIAENNTSQRREGTITIHSGDLQEVVTVYQAGSEKNILLSKKEFVVSNEGEEISIDVTSSVDVELEMPDVDWITRNVSRAASTNTYYFTIAENTTPDQREAYIIFKNTEKNISERVKVTQVQKDAIVLAQSVYNIDKEGGALDFDILTNVEIKISISKDAQSWITQIQTRGLETRTLYFDIAPYDGDATREGSITISGGNATQTITICQHSLRTLEDNKIYYTSSDGKIVEPGSMASWGDAEIISNTYEDGQGVITFNKNLTEIGALAFCQNQTLTSITIPNSVKVINVSAFDRCEKLAEVNFGSDLETLGGAAFYECIALNNVTIPKGIETLENNTFYGCQSLTSISIPDNVKTIKQGAFRGCSNLANVDLGNGVETIEMNVFYNCDALKSITIPQSVIKFTGNPFTECNKLEAFYGKFASADNTTLIANNEIVAVIKTINTTEYNIPDGVTKIAYHAFAYCDNIQTINIPESVTEIGYGAFYACNSLQSIDIPNGVTQIQDQTFRYCWSLAQVTLPNTLTYIGTEAFEHTGLIEVIIPQNVTNIQYGAFAGCNNLTSFYGKFATDDNRCLIINNKLVGFASKGLTEYTLPYGITMLRPYSLAWMEEQFTSITIPNSVKTIESGAFWDCNIVEVTIPESVTSIGDNAFAYIETLSKVYVKATTPPKLGSDVFSNNADGRKIYVPRESVDTYKSAQHWSEYADAIVGYDF